MMRPNPTARARAARHAAPLVLCALLATSPASAQGTVPASFAALDSSVSIRPGAGSAPLSTLVTVTRADGPRREIVRAIGAQAGVSILFDAALPGLDDVVAAQYVRVPAATALLRALAGSDIRALVAPSGTQVVLVSDRVDTPVARRLTGSVRTVDGPVPSARIELLGTGFRTTTHDDGTFAIPNVPAGDYSVRVSRLGYRPLLHEPIHVQARDDAPVLFVLARDAVALEAVVVTPGYFGLLEQTRDASQSLSREQLETVPQIGEDIYRAINRLPGVEASDFSARFSVRGATADQLYVTLDGLRLIEPFHLKDIGSALSIIDIQTLGQASLSSGGASAAFGDQLGGVFEMHSLDPRTDRPRSTLGLSLTNLRATSQGSFGDGKGGWLVSGRRGFLDLAFRLASLGDSIRPSYNDVFAKVQYDLPQAGQAALHALHSGDRLRYVDFGEERIDTRYMSNYVWLTVRQPLGARWRSETVLSAGLLDWRRTGQSSAFDNPEAHVADERSLRSLEARQDWSFRAGERSAISFGVDARSERAEYDYERTARRREVSAAGVVTVAESLGVHVQPEGTSIGGYVTHRWRPLDAFTLETGLRVDESAGVAERVVSPRTALAWDVGASTTLRGSWGTYVQAHPLFGLSVEDGEQGFSFADRSDQAELSVEQQLPRGVTARANAYRRLLSFNRPRYVNATSAIASFPEVRFDRVLIPPGGGRSRGIEVAVGRMAGARAEWSASYAVASAVQEVGGRDVPRATDQRHTVHFDWSWHPASNVWRLAIAGTWHTGTPDTPEIVTVDTLVNTPTQFSISSRWAPGPLYSDRVPAYRRVDIRWTRYFLTKRGRMSVFGELFNALDTENTRGYYTNVAVSGRSVVLVRGMRSQLPRLPSAGFSWEF